MPGNLYGKGAQAAGGAVDEDLLPFLDVSLLDGNQVRKLELHLSEHILGATHSPLDGQVNPISLTFGFALGAKALGARVITGAGVHGIDTTAGRVSALETEAGRFEADIVINAAEEDPIKKVDEVTSGVGADIVAICCQSSVAFQQAFEVVRGGPLYQMTYKGAAPGGDPMGLGGKVVMVAGTPPPEWRPPIVQKALTLIGSWGGRGRQALTLMQAGKVNTEPCITHQFSLDDINEAFETALKRDDAIKVLVKP